MEIPNTLRPHGCRLGSWAPKVVENPQDLFVYNVVLKACKQSGQWQHAEHLLYNMPVTPDALSFFGADDLHLFCFKFCKSFRDLLTIIDHC